jgi:hypothetical protein
MRVTTAALERLPWHSRRSECVCGGAERAEERDAGRGGGTSRTRCRWGGAGDAGEGTSASPTAPRSPPSPVRPSVRPRPPSLPPLLPLGRHARTLRGGEATGWPGRERGSPAREMVGIVSGCVEERGMKHAPPWLDSLVERFIGGEANCPSPTSSPTLSLLLSTRRTRPSRASTPLPATSQEHADRHHVVHSARSGRGRACNRCVRPPVE